MSDRPRIGLMGGTFDPIHMGHLVLAEQVRAELSLEKVYFVPAGTPPHKNGKVITQGNLRREMVHRAISDHEDFEIYDYELDRDGLTYTIDTVRAFKRDWNEAVELYFITGADQLLQLESWKDYRELLSEVTFVAASRPGSDEQQFRKKIEELGSCCGNPIVLIEIPALAISSSEIRQRVATHRSIRYLVPSDVEGFIRMNYLYR